MSSHNKVLIALNKMTLEEKSTYKIDPLSFLGKILTTMSDMDSKNNLTALEAAYIRLQTIINKHPNAIHNKKISYLQKEYKEAKKNYDDLLKTSRGNR